MSKFPEAVEDMLDELAPNRLTDFLYELSEKFNAFYVDCKVWACMVLAWGQFRSRFLVVGGGFCDLGVCLTARCGRSGLAWRACGSSRVSHTCILCIAPHAVHVPSCVPHVCPCTFMHPQVVGSAEEDSRLLLSEATARVMRQCFTLLGIKPLYKI